MKDKIIQFIDNTNEIFLMITGYSIILFSNWIYNVGYDRDEAQEIYDLPELRYQFGWMYLLQLAVIIGVNFCLILYEIVKALRKNRRKRVYYKKWEAYYKNKILAPKPIFSKTVANTGKVLIVLKELPERINDLKWTDQEREA